MIDITPRDGSALIISLAAATIISFVLYRRTSPTLPLRMRVLLGVIRWFAAMIVLLLVTDPVVRLVRTEYKKPVIAVLVDDSASMAYPRPEDKIEEAKQVLSPDFIERLASKADLRFYAFSERAVEITRDDLESLEPQGSRTDLAEAIRTVLDESSVPPSGYVVLSDGAVNFGEDVVNLASTLRSPVNVVAITGDEATPDISLDRIGVTETAYAGTEVPVSLLVSARGTGPVELSLTIKDSTGSVFSRQVSLAGTGTKTTITAGVDAGEIGTHDFTVELDKLDTEPVTSNNSGVFSLDVIKGKIRVVLVASRPSWDFAFARRSLGADPNIEVFSLFTDDAPVKPEIEGMVAALSSLPDLDAAVVFGDGASGPFAGDLREAVRNGLGLVLLMGPDAGGFDEELTPFARASGGGRGGSSVSAAATDAGAEHEILRLSGAAGMFSWSDLPPVPTSPAVGEARAEATVLLDGRAEGGNVPVLAIMRYGQGRVVGFSAFDLWRWDLVPKGFGLEASPFSQILLNSIGWLTETDEVRRLSVSTSKKSYLWGEPVDLFARAVDENLKPLAGVLLEGDVENQATGEISHDFTMADKGGGSHMARIDHLPPGRYRAGVKASLEDQAYGEETVDFAVDRRGLEDFEYDGDPTLLGRVSAATGGGYYRPADAGLLADEINPGMVMMEIYSELRLPLSLPVFLILAALLGVEWLLRKRRMLL